MSDLKVALILGGLALAAVSLLFIDDAGGKDTGTKGACNITKLTQHVTVSAEGARTAVASGEVNCEGNLTTFYKRKQLPIDPAFWDKLAYGQKYQCSKFKTPIMGASYYRNCFLQS